MDAATLLLATPAALGLITAWLRRLSRPIGLLVAFALLLLALVTSVMPVVDGPSLALQGGLFDSAGFAVGPFAFTLDARRRAGALLLVTLAGVLVAVDSWAPRRHRSAAPVLLFTAFTLAALLSTRASLAAAALGGAALAAGWSADGGERGIRQAALPLAGALGLMWVGWLIDAGQVGVLPAAPVLLASFLLLQTGAAVHGWFGTAGDASGDGPVPRALHGALLPLIAILLVADWQRRGVILAAEHGALLQLAGRGMIALALLSAARSLWLGLTGVERGDIWLARSVQDALMLDVGVVLHVLAPLDGPAWAVATGVVALRAVALLPLGTARARSAPQAPASAWTWLLTLLGGATLLGVPLTLGFIGRWRALTTLTTTTALLVIVVTAVIVLSLALALRQTQPLSGTDFIKQLRAAYIGRPIAVTLGGLIVLVTMVLSFGPAWLWTFLSAGVR